MAASQSSSAAGNTNIMLAIFEKKTNTVDLYRPLRNYITFHYSEREAQNLEDDLQTLKQLRSDIERHSDPSLPARRDLFITYFKALCQVETRFPISPEPEHVNALTFVWFDAFKSKLKASQQNIHLEKGSVLFNLGAVYSQIGLSFDRNTVDGRRQASHAFMGAAGSFAFLRDNASVKISVGSSTTLDLSAECAGMLEKLMLAQAQECVFENTIAKGSTPGVCAKISRQVGLYYEEALAALNVAPLNQHFDKSWIVHVQLKAAIFYAEACYRYGLELHEKEEIAEEISRLKSAVSVLTEAKKNSRGAAAQLPDAINKLEGNINRNLERAVKENDRVYLMRVPSHSSLSPLPAFAMVKPMVMNEVLDASKEKMFTSLVPDNSAKALSRYTEMVDHIIRTQAEKLQQASELTRVRLKEMELPDSILALEGNFTLPTNLKEDVEAVQISGGPAGLEAELQQLKDLRRVNQELLVQTEELLQKESREDAQFRSQFGTKWTRPQSSTLTKNLLDRLNRFAGNLKQAADSDARIERSVREHSALMAILDARPIESALPSLARPIMSFDQNEDAIVGSLKQSLRQLETLGAQRAGLEDMLREMKRKDDILPKLMTSTGSYEDLFKKELAKYDHICEEIGQNIEAQEQLLLQIQAQNDEFSVLFNLEDYKASREKSYKQIEAAIAKFREIKDNINEGLKFYVTLQDAITNVKQQSNDFVMTRNIQCREMIEDVQRQVAGLSFQDKNSGGFNNNYPPVGNQNQRPNTQTDPRHQTPYYQQSEQPPVSSYGHPPPSYGSPYGSNYEKAAALIDLAEDGVGIPEQLLDSSNFQSYSRFYFIFTKFDLIWSLSYFALIVLNFLEKPLWCEKNTTHSCNDRDYFFLGQLPYLTAAQCIIYEGIVLVLLIIHTFWPLSYEGPHIYWKSPINLLKALCLLVILADMLVYALYMSPVAFDFLPFRIAPYIRVVLFVLNIRELRETTIILAGMLDTYLNILALGLLFLVFTSWVAYVIFEDTIQGKTVFTSYTTTLYQMFLLFTTANNPDVWVPAYKASRLSCIFFILFVLVGVYFVTNLILAVVYESFKSELVKQVFEMDRMRRAMLERAFNLLDTYNVGYLNKDQIIRLFEEVNNYRTLPKISKEEFELIFEELDDTHDVKINKDEFADICNAIALKFQKEDVLSYFDYLVFYHSPTSKRLKAFVRSTIFGYIVTFVLIVNLFAVIIETTLDIENSSAQKAWQMAEFIFGWIYVIEMVLKVYSYGFENYWRDGQNRFDFVITVIIVIGETIDFAFPDDALPFFTNGEWIRYLLLARMLRLIRLLMHVQRFRSFVATFLTLIPSLMPYLGTIFCILCIYCSLGVQIFGGLVNAGNPDLEATDLAANDYLLFNFNDYPNGMVALFNLLVSGIWGELMESYRDLTGTSWTHVYFISFYLITVLLLLNLIIAFVLEAFFAEIELESSETCDGDDKGVAGDRYPRRRTLGTKTRSQRVDALLHHMLSAELCQNHPSST